MTDVERIQDEIDRIEEQKKRLNKDLKNAKAREARAKKKKVENEAQEFHARRIEDLYVWATRTELTVEGKSITVLKWFERMRPECIEPEEYARARAEKMSRELSAKNKRDARKNEGEENAEN